MKIDPNVYARLASALDVKKRAAVTGNPLPASKLGSSVARIIDASNTQTKMLAAASRPNHVPGLISLAGAPPTLADSGLTANGFQFDESQELALKKLVRGKHVALIGAAGTGKTTLVKHAMAQLIYGAEGVDKPLGIRRLDGEQGPSIAVCAFTGIAVQVVKDMLPAWMAPACKTIHSLLEYAPTEEKGVMFLPRKGLKNKLDHDLILIDEASMVGLDLWHNLVDALRPETRIILIGDLNQLKPVADATMFAYALSAGVDKVDGWDIAELTTIHRQKEAAANRIVDGAYAILTGEKPRFDPPEDPDWRIIGYELPARAQEAHNLIVGAVNRLRKMRTPDNHQRPLFDPYQDLLLTAGNGEDSNNSMSMIQQIPLNESLSRIIEEPTKEHPMYIIDAGRSNKRFAVGHRIMCLKNESPAAKDRVTNGMTGRITQIEPNPAWNGNHAMFGTEEEVNAFRKTQALRAFGKSIDGIPHASTFEFSIEDAAKELSDKEIPTERQASHVVHVKYANGATRKYATAAGVEGIQLAYAMTVHKAQGSQADTVIVIVHQAAKAQLSREWLYTAVTRAKRRVIILYTPLGLTTAIHRQQIFGATLKQKIDRYRDVMTQGKQLVRLCAE